MMKCEDRRQLIITQNPTEKVVTLSQYLVNATTLRTLRLRQQHRQTATPAKKHEGHNEILSEAQNEVIHHYIRRSYEAGYDATKIFIFIDNCYIDFTVQMVSCDIFQFCLRQLYSGIICRNQRLHLKKQYFSCFSPE
jgi:hypothetical protein